jgi:hypothetical protein
MMVDAIDVIYRWQEDSNMGTFLHWQLIICANNAIVHSDMPDILPNTLGDIFRGL